MSSYLIKYRDNQISVFECCDTQLATIRNRGEESWEYQGSSFWNWFKEKIEYEDEELSFIVLCDKEFSIDRSIKFTKKHIVTQEQIEDIVFEEDFKVQSLLLFPNQYKAKDIIHSIQKKKNNAKKLLENEIKKKKQIESIKQKIETLEVSLKNEQNIQSKTLTQKEQLSNNLKSFKDSYVNSLKETMSSFETQTLPYQVENIVTKTMKFALTYTGTSDVERSTEQALDAGNYISIDEEEINKYEHLMTTKRSLRSQIAERVAGLGHTYATSNQKISKKIEIKLDTPASIELEGSVDENAIYRETKKFYESEFSKLTVEYDRLQKNTDRLSSKYIESIDKAIGVNLNTTMERFSSKQMFTNNIFFTADIITVENKNYDELLNVLKNIAASKQKSGFAGMAFGLPIEDDIIYSKPVDAGQSTITIYPDKIIQLIKQNTDKINDNIIEIQKNNLTSILKNISSNTELFKNELSQQNIKIANIEKEIKLLKEQMN